jgi:hypothetical protein
MQEEWERLLAYAEGDDWRVPGYQTIRMHPLAWIRGGSRESLERVATGSYYDVRAAAGNILADPTGYRLESDLAIALVLRDEVLLQKALSRGESTPCHLMEHGIILVDFVMVWPRGLQMILDRPGAIDMNTNPLSAYGFQRALVVSAFLCNNGEDAHFKPCSNCSCCASLGILLEYQAPLVVSRIGEHIHSWKAMHMVLIISNTGETNLPGSLERSWVLKTKRAWVWIPIRF